MTVKPEHGKRYNTRDGQVVGPMNVPPIGNWEPIVVASYGRLGWCLDGKYLYGKVSPLDLVSEYIEPTAELAWIEWHGGECPIKSDKTVISVMYETGEGLYQNTRDGWRWCWNNNGKRGDIIAYRITENHEPTEPAPIDMSQNSVQWGLLTDAEKAALEEWAKAGKKVLLYSAFGWSESIGAKIGLELLPTFTTIYRTVSPPVITEERQDISTAAGHLVTVTLTLHDGKPISGTVVV